MLLLKPLLAHSRIGKCFRRYRSLGAESPLHERSNHFNGFFRCKIDSEINISRQPGIAMQQRGKTTDHNVPHTGRVQNLEYGLEDKHKAILAHTLKNISRSRS